MLLSTYVKRTLERIAKDGLESMDNPPGKWMGFDDADIKWFLDRYKKKTGPNLDWLRDEYRKMLEYDCKGELVLFFFPVDQKHATGILGEIAKRNKK